MRMGSEQARRPTMYMRLDDIGTISLMVTGWKYRPIRMKDWFKRVILVKERIQREARARYISGDTFDTLRCTLNMLMSRFGFEIGRTRWNNMYCSCEDRTYANSSRL